MADHKFVPITEALFQKHQKHLAKGERCFFVTKGDIPNKFKDVIRSISQKDQKTRSKRRHMVVTEPLSLLEAEGVKRIAEKFGYRVACESASIRLGYLCSDFGGHYSTDYYEFLEYTKIRVTLIVTTKK